jgi:hypothetical protein
VQTKTLSMVITNRNKFAFLPPAPESVAPKILFDFFAPNPQSRWSVPDPQDCFYPRREFRCDFCMLCAAEAMTKRGFALTSASWINRLGVALIAIALTVGTSVSTVHAVGDARKVSVVSFGLFGDQGVFRREASGAAQVVAGHFPERPDQCAI